MVQGNVSRQTREAREHLTRKSDVNPVSIVPVPYRGGKDKKSS
eukprot:COSAG02_NODE_31895_length_525_cov_1.431925_1_plen_42_part_10